ncbi:unnamed protein product [Periconia digitata]|uniref:C2H2-type domain-containing protein n=1 Tax=Periconia digitata TaxID=1303443 RepID=A0A9W4UA07_9PLEO|nr:unnamed protein product [Periconia digitata]
MSQPNPTYDSPFDYTLGTHHNLFDSHSSQVHSPSYQQHQHQQQWSQQSESRPAGPAPSPSPSQQTPVSASSTNPLKPHGMSMPASFHLKDHIEHNNSLLAVPQLGRTTPGSIDPSYSAVFGGIHDPPWSAVRLRNNSFPNGTSLFSHPDPNYTTYRDGPPSDLGSGAPRSDSGYQTQYAPSVTIEPERPGQDISPQISIGMGNMTVASSISEPTEVIPMSSDQASQWSGRSGSVGKSTFFCSVCKEVSKCPSDYKKHRLKHDKPHVCNVHGCRRAAIGRGFTTKNDLDRHKKSVHRVGVEKGSYQCASEHCRNKGKIWPRLDNFKQHIHRMHKDEDEHDLVTRSAYRESYAPNGESFSVAPLDTALAGIGTDKQFSGKDLDDPTSGMSLTPDQKSSRWNSFDATARDFALDVDRANDDPHETVSAKASRRARLEPSHGKSRASRSYSGNGARRRQDSLRMLADVAGITGSRSQLSSAPQTKAEQQRQVLQQLSKTISDDLPSGSYMEHADLEKVVLKVLRDATGQSSKESLLENSNHSDSPSISEIQDNSIVITEAEMLKASRDISDLIKKSRRPRPDSSSRRSSKASPPHRFPCDRCDITVSRLCDLKKHTKRHTKPYGCTYPKCFKRFGAKSDWKRHENSQHYQQEVYLCHYPSTVPSLTPSTEPFTPCNELYYHSNQFRAHLEEEHKISDPQKLERDLRERRIGMGNQRRFWCGFCKTIVPLREKRNAAWDERFDHIDNHFSKKEQRIEDWTCLEAGKAKGELQRQLYERSLDDDGDGDADDDGDGEDLDAEGVPDDSPPAFLTFETPLADVLPVTEPFQVSVAGDVSYLDANAPGFGAQSFLSSSRKRQVSMEEHMPSPIPKRRKGELDLYCCSCESAPWSLHTSVNCVRGNHHLCNRCTAVIADVDGSLMMGCP